MTFPLQSPGVYVKEEDRGPKPIQALGTSMAAFLGITREASRKKIDPKTGQKIVVKIDEDNERKVRVDEDSCQNKPILVTSWTQFVDIFGEWDTNIYLPDAVYGYFANGGGPCYVVSLRAIREAEVTISAEMADTILDAEKAVKKAEEEVKAAEEKVKAAEEKVKVAAEAGKNSANKANEDPRTANDDPNPKAADKEQKAADKAQKAANDDLQKAKDELQKAKDELKPFSDKLEAARAAARQEIDEKPTQVPIRPLDQNEVVGDATKRTGLGGLMALDDVRLVLCPDIMAGYTNAAKKTSEELRKAKELVKTIQIAIIDHCRQMRYQFAILDTPPGLNAQEAREWKMELKNSSNFAALYYPWIKVADLGSKSGLTKQVPPSGHMAGVFNRSDAERGVHKAPANETVQGAVDLELNLSKGEQDVLNPIGVNCIRSFPGRGIRVWGARTLDSGSGDVTWQYINVRRLFIMVESSIEASLQWVVFEPNDTNLWARVTRDITEFLRNVWRSGALFGATPSEAFYVKCDEELNPRSLRDLGQLHIEIGLAPTKPAEFVVVHITQWAGPNAEAG